MEDDASTSEAVALALEGHGHTVETAATGDEALERWRRRRPDLVLLDVMLPGLDGFELVRRLRADPRGAAVKIVMLTAKGQRRDRALAEETGADAFISKPFSNRALVDTVQRLAGVAGGGR